ncbi:Pc06g01220 [Penicillium rubens Wisconsin 54-1255]|uniref:Pc06g01220 protein n=1 Tax=Penicillium rubens (strain ATCC 28089 / DSM 1075 / NRRL 1951 / Wisconsin 54-1255) TaxID=500485 RepID=B6GW59_PENRW|nr:Pc06g01220 [Penicillium rubens Wisconsin 54-1255]
MDEVIMSSPLLKKSLVVPATYPRAPATVQSPGVQLSIAVNEYRPSKVGSGATLLLTHGTSFCKEMWEPLIEFWFRVDSPLRHQAVFAIDAVNHGDSAVLNRGLLGTSRHSFGGGTLAHASILSPKTFDATILVEPILFQMKEQTTKIAKLVLNRRDTWKNLYGRRWQKRPPPSLSALTVQRVCRLVFEPTKALCCKHLLKQILDSSLTMPQTFATHDVLINSQTVRALKTSKEQESRETQATYLAGPHPQIVDLLSKSREPHYYIMGGKSLVLNEDCRAVTQTLSRIHGDMAVVQDGGHLLPMAHPAELGSVLEGFIAKILLRISHTQSNL